VEKMKKYFKKKIDGSDAPIDIIDLHNLTVPFLKKRSKG